MILLLRQQSDGTQMLDRDSNNERLNKALK